LTHEKQEFLSKLRVVNKPKLPDHFELKLVNIAINSLKTIRKNIDESLKSFCGGSGISDPGYPKRFFSAVTTEYICYRKSGSLIWNDRS